MTVQPTSYLTTAPAQGAGPLAQLRAAGAHYQAGVLGTPRPPGNVPAEEEGAPPSPQRVPTGAQLRNVTAQAAGGATPPALPGRIPPWAYGGTT